ncbi:DUF3995 domain-containing protein [Leucobacter sp. CSA2]|uniref:DUF3995 domain-containing protein n=1 Tax=Leucobacter edaphi TaxID=2796472 RepID=A0A934UYD2_9MICO|nr:DUF3995 domain-containing protein [Leucobacter edaphi]MBK0422721.1 DUF3995 domain-containing protein [Leucobacter edaphi]
MCTRAGRAVAWAGLTGVGVLHLVWASGSSWPERNRRRLGEAVVGSRGVFPSTAATATVGALLLGAGAVAGGSLGEGRGVTAARRFIGAALLARAALGGGASAAMLGLPPVGKRFTRLDRERYRPLCLTLGAATLVGAAPRRASGS